MEYADYVHDLRYLHSELALEIASFNTLENVLEWMRLRGLSLGSIDVVTQDEYSLDFLLPLSDGGQYLVFGIT